VLKVIAVTVVVLIAAIVVLAATRPDGFKVERSMRIGASPDKILPLINDFHQWGTWSPFDKLDPSMKRTFAGAASGKGAVYAWEGNSSAGKGRMEIVEAAPTATVIKLDFDKPFTAHNIARFTAQPQGDSTVLTWSMEGPLAFPAKVMGLFFNMDKAIGSEFETGLASLKVAAEK